MGDRQFRQALFGYNKEDVERYLAQTTEERGRLNDALARVETLMAELQEGPMAIIEAAHRQAAEIKASAEREAARHLNPPSPPTPVVTVPVTSAVTPSAPVAVLPATPDVPAVHAAPVAASFPVIPPPLILPALPVLPEIAEHPTASFLQPFVPEDLPTPSSPSSGRQEPAWDVEFLHPNPPSQWRRFRVAGLAVGCAALLGFLSVHFRDRFAIVPAKVQASSIAAPIAVPAAPAAAPAAAPVDADAPKSMTLTISAEKPCWIRMTVDGTPPVERVLQPSETLVLHALDKASLRVGDAGAIKLLINSRPAKPLGANGEVVNRLITMENYTSFLAAETTL